MTGRPDGHRRFTAADDAAIVTRRVSLRSLANLMGRPYSSVQTRADLLWRRDLDAAKVRS